MKRYSRLTQLLPWLICGLGAIFYSYEYFLRITPSVMTDDLMKFYHIQDGALGSLSAFYYYIYTPMQLVVGVLMDRYGPRRLLTIATLCCVAGSVLFATTHELFIAELGRLLIGFGSAFAFVGVLKLGTIWLPRKYFALFAGLATSLGMIGAIIGDNLMTAMKNVLGWQETVLISAAFGVLLALAIGLFVRDKKVFDNTPKVTSNLVKFSDALPGLLKIALTPQFWVVGAIGALLYVPASVFAELWGIPYLETHFHFSDTDAASAISLVFLGWVFGGPLYGLFSEKIHSRNIPLIVASLASTLAFIVLIVPTSLPEWSVFTLLFLIGFVASGQSLVFAIGKELGPAKLAGSSIAFVNMAVMLGGPNDEQFGPRFISLENLYNSDLRHQFQRIGEAESIKLHDGIYISVLGPVFETPAEIRAFRLLGADVVGMSTVPEVIVAHHCGMNVAVLAAVTNLAAGMHAESLSHEITLQGAKLAADKIKKLLIGFISRPAEL